MQDRKKNSLSPSTDITIVKSDKTTTINENKIEPSSIGEKAYGLACLPQKWTLPWFIISSDCFSEYSNSSNKKEKEKIINSWTKKCEEQINSSDISRSEKIIIRSSGTNETLKDRGKFYSRTGEKNNFKQTLRQCLEENSIDPDSSGQEINFVVQAYAEPKEKGHLSNERRCSKEARDWLGEVERSLFAEPFKVNYRRWRTNIDVDEATKSPIQCELSIKKQKSLTKVAAWATQLDSRLHFEWVWDGRFIYLVQAEKEIISGSFDPTHTLKKNQKISKLDLECFRLASKNDAKKFRKIKNIFTYLYLNLPIVPIYILDKKDVIKDLKSGIVSNALSNDIEKLTRSSLIIRTDLSSGNQQLLQMLPRSEELRNKANAINWLQEQSKALLGDPQIQDEDIAFICHNFIPSESAAFAFATPNERKVQIESLWGIPEGLYYNAHDKFVVDTLNRKLDFSNDSIAKYKTLKKIQFKNYCVAPDRHGKWKMQEIAPPYDWRPSIRKEEWLTYIAANSRRIAEQENKPISVMWFVGLNAENEQPELIPWFHEECSVVNPYHSKKFHKKNATDKIFNIQYEKDIEDLKTQLNDNYSNITHIRVKPVEEHLLREKTTLRRIGEIAKNANKIILLEGATLSHAYYQLVQVGALVQAEAWFEEDTEVKEFHKLVRDKVPDKISDGGERVDVSILKGDSLNKALKEKLVEEALEVLDTKDYESLLEELADVQEVIHAILAQVGSNRNEIDQIQKRKREKSGGFSKGLVLEGTSNPSIHSQSNSTLSLDLELESDQDSTLRLNTPGIGPTSTSWKDKRQSGTSEELLVNFVVPILEDSWSVESQDLQSPLGQRRLSKAKLKGTRQAGKLKIELSLYTSGSQLDLFQDLKPDN